MSPQTYLIQNAKNVLCDIFMSFSLYQNRKIYKKKNKFNYMCYKPFKL